MTQHISRFLTKSAFFGLNFHKKTAIALLASGLLLSGCNTSEVLKQGYIVDQESLDLTPVGSSREQVLLTLGTPSSTAVFDNEVFYYISQERVRRAAFLRPKLVNQSVLAVYFDEEQTVSNISNYQLKDGKVFDMISRTTPTAGKDRSFLLSMLRGFGGAQANQAQNAASGIF